jgi:hypothetical protein
MSVSRANFSAKPCGLTLNGDFGLDRVRNVTDRVRLMMQRVDALRRRPFVTTEVHVRAQRDLGHPVASVGGLAQNTDRAIVIFVDNKSALGREGRACPLRREPAARF